MQSRDDISRLLSPKFDARLKSHIASIDLSTISRISAERIEQTAIPKIGLVEFVSGDAFADSYDALYTANFHGGERERSDLIVQRLKDDFAGIRVGLAPYRVIGIRNNSGQAIAGAQFSVLFLKGQRLAVPYLQYIYVSRENRRQGLSELLHTLVLAVAKANAGSFSVPFTLFETEPPVHGVDESKRAVAAERTQIHSKSGSLALMLKQRSHGKVMSAHVQPGLELGEPPITLIWALRANPAVELSLEGDQMGRSLVAGYYQSLRDEGFPEKNIAFAEDVVERRYARGVEFCLLPLSGVTREMYVDID